MWSSIHIYGSKIQSRHRVNLITLHGQNRKNDTPTSAFLISDFVIYKYQFLLLSLSLYRLSDDKDKHRMRDCGGGREELKRNLHSRSNFLEIAGTRPDEAEKGIDASKWQWEVRRKAHSFNMVAIAPTYNLQSRAATQHFTRIPVLKKDRSQQFRGKKRQRIYHKQDRSLTFYV